MPRREMSRAEKAIADMPMREVVKWLELHDIHLTYAQQFELGPVTLASIGQAIIRAGEEGRESGERSERKYPRSEGS